MNARFKFAFVSSVVAFGAMVGGCATTVSNPWWYYHYDPSTGWTTMSNPWWYYHYDPYGYGYGYRYYGYPWPDYSYRYDPYYPYRRYDARPMVSPSPPAVFDDRASAFDRERYAASVRRHPDPIGTSELTNDRTRDYIARAVDTNDFVGR